MKDIYSDDSRRETQQWERVFLQLPSGMHQVIISAVRLGTAKGGKTAGMALDDITLKSCQAMRKQCL